MQDNEEDLPRAMKRRYGETTMPEQCSLVAGVSPLVRSGKEERADRSLTTMKIQQLDNRR